MTLAARVDTAIKIQGRLKDFGIHIDPVRLACDADYAVTMEETCRQVGQLDECLELLSALVDTIVLSGLPARDADSRLGDVHPDFADTVSDLSPLDIDLHANPLDRSHGRVRQHFEAGMAYLRQRGGAEAARSSPELLAAFVVAAASENLARALVRSDGR